MKKKTLQRAAALVMTGAMVMGAMTGCGSEPATNESTSAGGSTPSSESTPTGGDTQPSGGDTEPSGGDAPASTAAGMEGWTPFADTVTLQIPVYDRGDNGNGCSDVVNNYWTKWVQDNFGAMYNINVEYVAITRTDVMTDYTLLATGQDLPTVLMEYDYDKLATWQAEGYLQPYDMEQLKTVAPTFYQNDVVSF